MKITSILAIYVLFFAASVFVLLPFGVKTDEEVGAPKVPGQADSAPAHFNARRIMLRATVVAFVLFGLYYANYVNGWILPQDLDLFGDPPNPDGGHG